MKASAAFDVKLCVTRVARAQTCSCEAGVWPGVVGLPGEPAEETLVHSGKTETSRRPGTRAHRRCRSTTRTRDRKDWKKGEEHSSELPAARPEHGTGDQQQQQVRELQPRKRAGDSNSVAAKRTRTDKAKDQAGARLSLHKMPSDAKYAGRWGKMHANGPGTRRRILAGPKRGMPRHLARKQHGRRDVIRMNMGSNFQLIQNQPPDRP